MGTKQPVRTPGEPEAAATTEVVTESVEVQENVAAQPDQAQAAEPSVADLMKLIEEQGRQLRALTIRNTPQPQNVELPGYDETVKGVQEGKITSPVLTDKGWVVPPNFQAREDLRK